MTFLSRQVSLNRKSTLNEYIKPTAVQAAYLWDQRMRPGLQGERNSLTTKDVCQLFVVTVTKCNILKLKWKMLSFGLSDWRFQPTTCWSQYAESCITQYILESACGRGYSLHHCIWEAKNERRQKQHVSPHHLQQISNHTKVLYLKVFFFCRAKQKSILKSFFFPVFRQVNLGAKSYF